MIFIACPYWHPDESVRAWRAGVATAYAVAVRPALAYSPLTYGHTVATAYPDKLSESYWREHGLVMLMACDSIHVLMLPGWDESTGIEHEIRTWHAWGAQGAISYIPQRRLEEKGIRIKGRMHA